MKYLEVLVKNPFNHKILPHKALMIMDDGSSCTYISDKLAEKLQLPILSKICANIGVFNEFAFKTTELIKTKVELMLPRFYTSKILIVNSVNFLTQQVPFVSPNSFNIILGKTEPSITWSSPDILLENDYYNQFLPELVKVLPSGFDFLKNDFGLIITGMSNKPKPQITKYLTNLSTKKHTTLSSITHIPLKQEILDNKKLKSFLLLSLWV